MKISKRDAGLLLGLLGLLVAVAAYMWVYTPMKEKQAAIEAEIVVLAQRESELVRMQANLEHYKEEIVRLNGVKEEYIVEFPADIKPETEIMYAVELEEEVEVEFSTLSYGTPTGILQESTGNYGVYAYCLPMTMTYNSTYQGLKDTILYTNAHQNRMVIDAVTASYDGTTGNLTGSMTLNMYYINGTGKVYEQPYVPAMGMGVENIFGTIENPAEAE